MISEKQLIRTKYKALRKQLSPRDTYLNSLGIFKQVTQLEQYKSASSIFVFMSMEDEIDTYEFIETSLKHGKTVAIPKILDKKDMVFIQLTDINQVEKGFFNILKPLGDVLLTPKKDDIMIIPGLVYDLRGYRIGYGGGFYDRYLTTHTEDYLKIGVCQEAQLIHKLPQNDYDQKVDLIITERKIYMGEKESL